MVLPLTGIWTLGWFALMITVIYGLLTDPGKLDGEILLFMGFFFIAGLFIAKIFLWHLRGTERITIGDSEIEIRQKGTILSMPRKFELNMIDNFSFIEKSKTPYWLIFWGLGGGNIQFEYLGQVKCFGQSLTREEAKEIIGQLNEKAKATNP